MFARNEENVGNLRALEQLSQRVEFFGCGQMRQVARMQNKIGSLRQFIYSRNGLLQGGSHVAVDAFLTETNVRVADLHEAEAGLGYFRGGGSQREPRGTEQSAADCPEHSGASPSHALEEAAPIQAILVVVVLDDVFFRLHNVSR